MGLSSGTAVTSWLCSRCTTHSLFGVQERLKLFLGFVIFHEMKPATLVQTLLYSDLFEHLTQIPVNSPHPVGLQEGRSLTIKLRKRKTEKKVEWSSDTVDNEHLGRRSSKCECPAARSHLNTEPAARVWSFRLLFTHKFHLNLYK